MESQIIAINPGSTSTKIAVYEGEKELFNQTLRHPVEELAKYPDILSQFDFRLQVIESSLREHPEVDYAKVAAVVGRGGLLKPIESGVYEVNERMKEDLRHPKIGQHASNLGGLLAERVAAYAREHGAQRVYALIADPVVVDELEPVARITGLPQLPHLSIFHALNQKAIARRYAKEHGTKYEDLDLVVVHLGGGISVGAHHKGRVIDVNNALNGEGPLSPERAGSLPAQQLAELCFGGKYTLDEVKKLIVGQGGLVAHTGSNSALDLEKKAAAGDKAAQLLQDAMSYNTGKWVGAMAAVLKGHVDAILLTGGMAYNKNIVAYVTDMVRFIAPVEVYPGEDELAALALNGLAVVRGERQISVYA